MRHTRDANELLEVVSDELRAIVGDDSRLGFQVLFLGSLQDHFDIGFSQTPVSRNWRNIAISLIDPEMRSFECNG